MRRLFIVRHGNTFEPLVVPTRVGARTDLPLTVIGVAQAELLGVHFAKHSITFTRALCGRLRRTRQSMEAILSRQVQIVPSSIIDWLDEIDHGPDENQTEDKVVERVGSAALVAWERDGVSPDNWIVNKEWRIAKWRAFFNEHGEENCLLVTSNGAARFALAALYKDQSPASPKLRTGSYGEIVCHPDGSQELIGWNMRPGE